MTKDVRWIDMHEFGLNDRERSLLDEVFRRHPGVEQVRIFGSRAQGNQEPNSDVDLALWGKIDSQLLARLAAELDELPLPYHFDLSIFGSIRNDALKDHIVRVGKTVYQSLASSTAPAPPVSRTT